MNKYDVERQKVDYCEQLYSVSSYGFTLSELIKASHEWAEDKKRNVPIENLSFEFDYDRWSEDKELYVKGWRLETDEEYENRINRLKEAEAKQKADKKAAKIKKEQEELVLFEKLKKKYE